MERRSLLSVLNPQLQALVEASLGETLAQSGSNSSATSASSLQPPAVTTASLADPVTRVRDGVTPMNEQETNGLQVDQNGEKQVTPSATSSARSSAAHGTVRCTGAPVSYKLDPSELFGKAYIPTLNSTCILCVCYLTSCSLCPHSTEAPVVPRLRRKRKLPRLHRRSCSTRRAPYTGRDRDILRGESRPRGALAQRASRAWGPHPLAQAPEGPAPRRRELQWAESGDSAPDEERREPRLRRQERGPEPQHP